MSPVVATAPRARPSPATQTAAGARPAEAARAARRREILDLVASRLVASQGDLAVLLRERGFAVTQATVSRDIADLGLVKAPRGEHHAYVSPAALATRPGSLPGAGSRERPGAGAEGRDAREARLRRILADYPVRVARSGLTLVLVGAPGAASVIAQALDESPLDDEVGTLAGDNTLLVLFADEPALERWRARFDAVAGQAASGLPEADLTSTYP